MQKDKNMPNLIYHYTDWNGLNGILYNNTGNCILRASNILDLNDPTELNYGLDIIKDIIEKDYPPYKSIQEYSSRLDEFKSILSLEKIIKKFGYDIDIYVSSFSSAPNNFNMWKSYSDNAKGVSIGFAKDVFENHPNYLHLCRYDKKEIVSRFKFILYECDFLLRIIDGIANENEENFSNTKNGIIRLLSDCIQSKHHAYSYEQEIRLIKFNPSKSKLKKKLKAGKIVLYYEFEIPKNAVKEIWIGPNLSYDQQKSFETLDKIKKELNLNYEIILSDIPYKS